MDLKEAMILAFQYLEDNYECNWTTGLGNKNALIKAFSQISVPKHEYLGYKSSDGIRHSFHRAIPNNNKPKGWLWEHWLLFNIGLFQCSSCNSILTLNNKVSKEKCYLCKQCDSKSVYSRREIKQELVLSILQQSTGCVDCGEKDPICLEFDHRDPLTKEFNIGEGYNKSEKDILQEISKCDIVCANCHRKRTAKTYNQFRHKQGLLA